MKFRNWFLLFFSPLNCIGSGRDDYYSSSTQKQSIETITTSRNASAKLLSKFHVDNNFIKSPSIIETAAITSRSSNIINENDDACLSKVVSESGRVNIYPNENVQEIQLNIFPPSASYTTATRCQNYAESMSRCANHNECSEESANCLSIDVRQESDSSEGRESSDCQGKLLQGPFSHIVFKRSNSILHISIGNSSKITKRKKKMRKWIFTKIFSNRKESEMLDGKNLPLSNMNAVRVINDGLIICINKKNRLSTPVNSCQQNNEIYQNQLRSFLDLENGANELDLYMKEIKMREMGWF